MQRGLCTAGSHGAFCTGTLLSHASSQLARIRTTSAGPAAPQSQAPHHPPAQLQRRPSEGLLHAQPSAASIGPMLTLQDLGMSLSPEGSPSSQTPQASPRGAQPCRDAPSPAGSGAAPDAWQGKERGAQLCPGQALPWLMSEASALSVGPLPDQQQCSGPVSEASSSSPSSPSQSTQAADEPASSHVQQPGHAPHSEPSGTPAAAGPAWEDEQRPGCSAGASSGLQPGGTDAVQGSDADHLPRATELTAQHLLQPDQALHWLSAEPSAVSVQPVQSPGSEHCQVSEAAEGLDVEEGVTSEVIIRHLSEHVLHRHGAGRCCSGRL